MPNVPSNPSQLFGGNTSPSKKAYTSDEILKNFLAVNEELKQKGYSYYQLPSMQISQIWLDGKLTSYYPDSANIVYPMTVGPKGSITDYKNPNFDEALLRKYTDAKSLSDQYQQKVSLGVRSALASASDPSKVSVATVIAQVNSSVDSGAGRGITLGFVSPQATATSLNIQSELKRAGANLDSLSAGAVKNNDASSIIALHNKFMAASDTTKPLTGFPAGVNPSIGGQLYGTQNMTAQKLDQLKLGINNYGVQTGSQLGALAGNPSTGPIYKPGTTGAQNQNGGINTPSQQQNYDPMLMAQQQISTAIASGMEKLDAQNKAIAAGTWKPSDGYYFKTNYEPYSLAFDPTGQMKDYVPAGNNDWLKANGYDYLDTKTDQLVYGPKGNGGSFETDQSKKGEAQLINEQKWAELGVNLVGEPDRYGNARYGSAIENMNWSQQATKIIADPFNNPKNKPGLVDTSWLKPNGLTLEQAQAKAASLVNPVDGTPKPGVTQEMIAQAAKDVYISSGKLKVVNGMVVNTTNLITSDPMQSDMLPSPEWLKKMGYVVGTGGVDDVLGADGKMYSVQFPSEIAKANSSSASALAAATAATQSSKVLVGGAVIDKRIAEIAASGASQAVKDKALTEIKSGNPSSSADLIKWFGAGGGASVASTDPRTTAILNSSASQWVKDQAIAEINKGNTSDANALMAWFKPHDPTPAVVAGAPSMSPYNISAQPTVIMPTTVVQPVAPATITLTDKNNVSRTVAINSPEAIHVGSGGTYQDLDTVSAIYSRGDPTEIANWEKFSGSKPPAGGYTATNLANPYTPASTVAFTANNGQNPIYP